MWSLFAVAENLKLTAFWFFYLHGTRTTSWHGIIKVWCSSVSLIFCKSEIAEKCLCWMFQNKTSQNETIFSAGSRDWSRGNMIMCASCVCVCVNVHLDHKTINPVSVFHVDIHMSNQRIMHTYISLSLQLSLSWLVIRLIS